MPALITPRRAGALAAAAAVALRSRPAPRPRPRRRRRPGRRRPRRATAAAASGGTYNVGLITPTGGIDPLTTTQADTMFAVGLASAQLVIQSPSGTIEPQLAQSWNAVRRQAVVDLHAPSGPKFSNGKPLTAADVVSTFNSILSPTSQSPQRPASPGSSSRSAGRGHRSCSTSTCPTRTSHLLTGANTWILPAGFKATNWINYPVGPASSPWRSTRPGRGSPTRRTRTTGTPRQ